MSKKVVVILGPTASGKSDLAISLALWLGLNKNKKLFEVKGAEIISADSRQVYKGMDIGTGKISKAERKKITHHLLDVASPKIKFTVVQYEKLASKALNKILKNNKIPIICGGTGFYIQAIIDGILIPKVKPDWKLRKELERKTTKELFEKLKKFDLKRAETIDKHNKRRLIRALEIIIKTKKPVPILMQKPLPYPVLILGIKKEKKELSSLIRKRLIKRLKQGMVQEVKKLRKLGVSWKRFEEFGLEYRYVAQYLQNKITKNEMINLLEKEIENYAKRQMTWFTRDKRIKWIKNYKQAEKLTKEFLS